MGSYFASSITHYSPQPAMLRLTFLLLMFTGSVSAQTADTSATPAANAMAPARHTATDTVRALHRLFAKRRKVGGILTVGAIGAHLAASGVSAAAEGAPQSSGGAYGLGMGSFNFGFGGFAVIYGVVAAPVVGVGIQQLITYSPRREARIIAAYEADGHLSAKHRRQVRKFLR